MRGYCAFCWYWWNCCQSLLKLSFHKQNSNYLKITRIFLEGYQKLYEFYNKRILNLRKSSTGLIKHPAELGDFKGRKPKQPSAYLEFTFWKKKILIDLKVHIVIKANNSELFWSNSMVSLGWFMAFNPTFNNISFIYRVVTSARPCNKVSHLFLFTILAQHETDDVILYIHSVQREFL